MSWEPGKPVIAPDDVDAWNSWRKAIKLQQQRDRRAMHPRIDYYPSKEARAVILANISNRAGGDYSSVINRIIVEWADIPE